MLSKSLKILIKFYVRGSFIIRVILTDMEFKKVDGILGKVEAKISAVTEHAGEAEITIRTLEKCGRIFVNTLTYSYLPSHIIINLVYCIITCLNALPAGTGISQKYSPR